MGHYDNWASTYNQLVEKNVANKTGIIEDSYQFVHKQILKHSGYNGKKICDIGCGQGELALRMVNEGAAVTGIDNSQKLLELAKRKSNEIHWQLGDAMELLSVPADTFDVVVANLMLMDVPDYKAVLNASHRILAPKGMMIIVIMHPCFQSPFSFSLEDGSRNVSTYRRLQWKSNGKGTLRSTLGAYHRPLSDYINDFLETGFSIINVGEPLQANSNLPSLFGLVGRKEQ